MKPVTSILLLFACLLYTACKNTRLRMDNKGSGKKYIAIQPLGSFDKERAELVRKEITGFYQVPVVILPAVELPASFINRQKGERYSADSILLFLKQFKKDSIAEVVGLVHKDIYTSKKDKNGHIQAPVAKYAFWGIAGLGFLPGDECIISDARLKTKDSAVFRHRLRTVVIHEIGHNMGLPHCKVKTCIMSDTNEKIASIDNSRNDYCDECKQKLKKKF